MNTKIKRKSALNYFGGKSRFLDWLLPLFPEPNATQCKGYLESFIGGGSPFLNCEQYEIMVINDIDGRLYNFYNVLRNDSEKLIRLLELTLYSRNEFQLSLERSPDPVEDARRYFVRSQQSFGGQSVGTRRQNSWRASMTDSRHGVGIDVAKWLGKIAGLKDVVERFKIAQIENRSFDYVKPKFDFPFFFHYDDPPYIHSTRTGKGDYEHEMSNEQHEHLAYINNRLSAKVMISNYDNPFYNQWYPEVGTGEFELEQIRKIYPWVQPKWRKILGPERATNLGKTRNKSKREVIWINYDPPGSSHKLF
jgi:DNA adenine methylase